MLKYLLILVLCCCGVNLYGQTLEFPETERAISPVANPFEITDEPTQPVEGGRFFKEFLSMLFSLGLILAALLLATWLVKRFATARMDQVNESSGIKIVEKRSLSPRSTIYVLDIFGKDVVVGESHTGLTFLENFTGHSDDEGEKNV